MYRRPSVHRVVSCALMKGATISKKHLVFPRMKGKTSTVLCGRSKNTPFLPGSSNGGQYLFALHLALTRSWSFRKMRHTMIRHNVYYSSTSNCNSALRVGALILQIPFLVFLISTQSLFSQSFLVSQLLPYSFSFLLTFSSFTPFSSH